MARNFSFWRRVVLSFGAMAVIAFGGRVLLATTYTYTQDTDATGVWTENNRWDAGAAFPNAVDDVAVLSEPITTTPDMTDPSNPVYTLTLNNQNITLGTLDIQNNTHTFLTHIGDGSLADGSLIFQTSSGPALLWEELGTVDSLASRTRIFSPITVNSDLEIRQDNDVTKNTSTEILGKINGSRRPHHQQNRGRELAVCLHRWFRYWRGLLRNN